MSSSSSDFNDISNKPLESEVDDLNESLPSSRPCSIEIPMNTSVDQLCLVVAQSPTKMTNTSRRPASIDVECFGLIQTSFDNWCNNNVHQSEDNSFEYLHGISDLLDMYFDAMEDSNVNIDEVLLPSYGEQIQTVYYDTCLNIHGSNIYRLVRDGIRDSLNDISPYHPFSTELNIIVPQQYQTYGGHSRSIDVLLLNKNPKDAAKNPILQSLCCQQRVNDQYYIFYHGCSEQACHSICLNGIGLHWSNSKGTDFGPGLYLGKSVLDALYIAQRRVESEYVNKTKKEIPSRPCCIVFLCLKKEYDQFSTLHSSTNGLDQCLNRPPIHTNEIAEANLLEWHNFVHLCHDNRYPLPLLKDYDSIQGPVCTNIRQVQQGIEFPRFRQYSYQLCVRTVQLAEKFTIWMKSVIILDKLISMDETN